jgi:hypothetical protein
MSHSPPSILVIFNKLLTQLKVWLRNKRYLVWTGQEFVSWLTIKICTFSILEAHLNNLKCFSYPMQQMFFSLNPMIYLLVWPRVMIWFLICWKALAIIFTTKHRLKHKKLVLWVLYKLQIILLNILAQKFSCFKFLLLQVAILCFKSKLRIQMMWMLNLEQATFTSTIQHLN